MRATVSSASPRRRWLGWVLAVSLGVNLAVVGLGVGMILHTPHAPRGEGPGLGSYARALPVPFRRDLGQALREHRGEWTGSRQALRAQRMALVDELIAEPFDAARVVAVLARETAIAETLAERGAELLAAQIARMTPAEREAYAAELEAAWRDRRERQR